MQQQNSGLFDIPLDQQSFTYLSESSKWARFIAICGFIFCVMIAMIGIFAGTIFASMGAALGEMGAIGGGFFTVFYLILAVLMFFPNLYLFRFSSRIRQMTNMNEPTQLQEGLRNLKGYFKFVGIMLIILLCFYALAIVGGVVAGVAGSFA